MKCLKVSFVLAAACISMVAACSKESAPSTDHAAPAAKVAAVAITPEAREFYKNRCATCHGPEGRGDGVAAAALTPKPRNYHDKEWQAKVTDEDIRKTVVYGGAAVGKSPIMPSSPDLEAKPEIVTALVQIVREFGK